MLEILKAPNEILSQKSKNVPKIDKSILDFLKELEAALDNSVDPIGVGLAAPQVGKQIKIFIAKPTEKSKMHVFINPHIIKTSKNLEPKRSKVKKLEGCLSLPNIWGEVSRYENIVLIYQDELCKLRKRKFSGFMATIIQHEIDHLNGILFTKRVLEQKGLLYKSEKDEKGEDVFEEIKI